RGCCSRSWSSSALVLVHDLGVNDVFLVGGRAVTRGAAVARRAVIRLGGGRLLLGLLVHRLGDLVEGRVECVGLGLDVVGVLGGQRLADRLDRGLDLLLGGGVDRIAELGELTLGLVGRVLGGVAGLGELTLALVVLGVRLGVGDHPLDLLIGEPGA